MVRPVPAAPPSRCAKVLYYTWRLCSVLFSHLVMISLVVAYCILGAVTFERLEADYERQVKQNISQIRKNATANIWGMTQRVSLLDQRNWTTDVLAMLQDFESAILLEMKVRGWDGNESTTHLQWTFTGALFYSIIVITTIGYGHIAPKTQAGKVVTIFYAILGIPLMLLCLSNIGDVMASSFRFLYWRACCYVCTRPPKRHRRRRSAPPLRRSGRGSTRRRRPLQRAHSDTDCRYRDSGYSSTRVRPRLAPPRTRSQPPPVHFTAPRPNPRLRRPDHDHDHNHDDEFPRVTLPLHDLEAALQQLEEHHSEASARGGSTGRPELFEMSDLHTVDRDTHRQRRVLERRRAFDGEPDAPRIHYDSERFCQDQWDETTDRWEDRMPYTRSLPRHGADLVDQRPRRYTQSPSQSPSRSPSPGASWSDMEGAPPRRVSHLESSRAWSGRAGGTTAPEATLKEEIKPVPIWLCVVLVASYIVAGTFLFKRWEGWAYLDAAYFCFITLTTIGFGDFVPAQGSGGSAAAAVHSIALCSLYLLFGIALLAMSFNLVQEEVRANVAALATKLGIIKAQRDQSDDDATLDSDSER